MMKNRKGNALPGFGLGQRLLDLRAHRLPVDGRFAQPPGPERGIDGVAAEIVEVIRRERDQGDGWAGESHDGPDSSRSRRFRR